MDMNFPPIGIHNPTFLFCNLFSGVGTYSGYDTSGIFFSWQKVRFLDLQVSYLSINTFSNSVSTSVSTWATHGIQENGKFGNDELRKPTGLTMVSAFLGFCVSGPGLPFCSCSYMDTARTSVTTMSLIKGKPCLYNWFSCLVLQVIVVVGLFSKSATIATFEEY
jgi:hypothetical protein